MIAGNLNRGEPESGFATARKLLARADGFACLCHDGRIVLVNDTGLTMLKAKAGGRGDPAGQSFRSLLHEGDAWALDSWWKPAPDGSTDSMGTRRYCRVGTPQTGYQYLQLTRAEHVVGDTQFEIIFGKSVEHISTYKAQLADARKELLHNEAILRRERHKRKWAERNVRKLAYEDHLTRLSNRAHFQLKLESALHHAQRTGKYVVLLFIDLDRFKDINDSLGHSTGDRILKQVADRLRRCVRSTDTVARFGSDEFAIIADDVCRPSDVDTLAEKVLESMRLPFYANETAIEVGCSIGISIFPENGADLETLQKNAVLALQRAKSIGVGRYQIFDAAMNEQIRLRKQMDRELTRAIDQEQIVAHYQPQVDISTGRVRGLEALVRWNHPSRGLVPPAMFIPAAETSGLIVPLTEKMLASACQDLKRCHTEGQLIDKVSVNLSATILHDTSFLGIIERTLADTGLAPKHLEVEVTESMVLEDIHATSEVLKNISEMGIGVSLDDFGTGYSSLTHLRSFPLTTIKIDRSFVIEMSARSEDIAIVRAVISLAHSLGLRAIAEGVEHIEQLEILRAENCDEVQGFYFSRPLPIDELISWCRKHGVVDEKKTA